MAVIPPQGFKDDRRDTHIRQTETEDQNPSGDKDCAREREPEPHLRLVDTLVPLGEQHDGTVVKPTAVEEAEEGADEGLVGAMS